MGGCGYDSHTPEELIAAQRRGEQIWRVTGGGDTDYLIGARHDVLRDLLAYHDLAEMPDGWTIDLVDWDLA